MVQEPKDQLFPVSFGYLPFPCVLGLSEHLDDLDVIRVDVFGLVITK